MLKNRRNLSSIFRQCSYIGIFRANFLGCEMTEEVEKLMNDVPIKHLIVYDKDFHENYLRYLTQNDNATKFLFQENDN